MFHTFVSLTGEIVTINLNEIVFLGKDGSNLGLSFKGREDGMVISAKPGQQDELDVIYNGIMAKLNGL